MNQTDTNTNSDINDDIIFGHAATVNPFEEADQRELNNQIHLRYKKRNGKKVWTFIEGLDKETAKKLCKKWRTKWGCSASVKKDEGEIIATLSGDHRGKVFNDLLEENEHLNETNGEIIPTISETADPIPNQISVIGESKNEMKHLESEELPAFTGISDP